MYTSQKKYKWPINTRQVFNILSHKKCVNQNSILIPLINNASKNTGKKESLNPVGGDVN
jgi:hypothetical protein